MRGIIRRLLADRMFQKQIAENKIEKALQGRPGGSDVKYEIGDKPKRANGWRGPAEIVQIKDSVVKLGWQETVERCTSSYPQVQGAHHLRDLHRQQGNDLEGTATVSPTRAAKDESSSARSHIDTFRPGSTSATCFGGDAIPSTSTLVVEDTPSRRNSGT
eukprot:9297475-Heterocapsa_arctica.AAC.1